MKISSREGITESQLHVEFPPAFSGGNRWRDGEIIASKRAGSGWRAKGEEAGQDIVSMFFISAQKTIFDQQKGPVAKTLGRIFSGSLFIRREPENQLDRLCRDQFQSLSSVEDFHISATVRKMLPIFIVFV